MSDPIDIAQQIHTFKDELEKLKPLVRKLAEKRAEAISDYDKKIALTLIGLRNGKTFELDNQRIVDPPATIMDNIAKGICYQEKLKKELADGQYKACLTNIETTKAQLNGLQSINKHLE